MNGNYGNYNYQYYNQYNQNGGYQPGKGLAITSLVLGIIGTALCCFGFLVWTSFISVVLGIVGLILAASAKSQGNTSSIRTAGFVLSLISLILGAVVFVSCFACVGAAGCGAAGCGGILDSMY